MKKTISILLSLVLLLGTVAFALPLAGAVDTPYEITEGEFLSVDVSGYDPTYIKFVPSRDGRYVFTSKADSNAYGYVFDENLNQLVSGGYSKNFRVYYDFEAGKTYYLGTRYYYGEPGSFKVRVYPEEDPMMGLSVVDVPLDVSTEITVPASDEVYLRFSGMNPGRYYITADNTATVNAVLYEAFLYSMWESSLDAGFEKGFYLNGQSDYLCLFADTEQTFHVTLQTEATYASANAVTLTENVPQSVSLPGNNEQTYFSFTPEDSAVYALVGTNGYSVNCSVYDHDFNYHQNRYITGRPLFTSVFMEAGRTYYYSLSSYETQSFDVTVMSAAAFESAYTTPIALDTPQSVSVAANGTRTYLSFRPAESGTYILSGDNSISRVYLRLYDSVFYEMYNGPFSNSLPLLCAANLDAGETYYFAFEGNNEETFNVTLTTAEAYFEDHAVTLVKDTPTSLEMTQNIPALLKFTPSESGSYVLVGENENYLSAEKYDAALNSYSSAYGSSFALSSALEAGKTYYYKLSSDYDQTFQVTLKKTQDHLDGLSTPLTKDVPQSVAISDYSQKVYLSFTPAYTGQYVLTGTNGDAYYLSATFYDDTMNQFYGNSMDTDSPLRRFNTLEAGRTYYYCLTSSNAQTFEVTITDAEDFFRDHGGVLTLDTAQSVSLNGNYDHKYYTFTPAASGSYTLVADNEQYTYCSIYNETFSSCGSNSATPLLCTATLTAGKTYYYCLESSSVQTFNVTVMTTKAYYDGRAKVLTLNEPLQAESDDYMMFEPASSGVYAFVAENGNQNIYASIYNDTMSHLNSDGNHPAVLFNTLEAGKTYYYHVDNAATCKVVTLDAFLQENGDGELTLGEPVSLTVGSRVLYTYTVENSTEYRLDGTSDNCWFEGFWCGSDFSNSYSFSGSSLQTNRSFSNGDTCYVFIGLDGNEGETGTFTLQSKSGYAAENAQPLTLDEPLKLQDCKNKTVYLSFTPQTTGRYLANFEAAGYFYSNLYSSTWTYVNSGSDKSFSFDARLNAGETYYFEINAYDNNTVNVLLTKSCDHSATVLTPEIPATCTENGISCGLRCTDCDEWVMKPMQIPKGHVDANKDRVCERCEGPAIEFVGDCNEAGTVTATLYTDGELVLSGAGAVTKAPFVPNRADYETEEAYSAAEEAWAMAMQRASSIFIPEGITRIETGFGYCRFKQITIPASCTYVSESAFSGSTFEDITILNDNLPLNRQFKMETHGPVNGNEQPAEFPFTVSSFRTFETVASCATYLVYIDYLIPMEIQAFMNEYHVTEEQAWTLVNSVLMFEFRYISSELGVEIPNGTTLAQLKEIMLGFINTSLGTSFTGVGDLWDLDAVEGIAIEDFDEVFEYPTAAFVAAMETTFNADLHVSFSSSSVGLGSYLEGNYTLFDGITVRGNCGSTAQRAAQRVGAAFELLNHIPGEPTEENRVEPTEEAEGSYEEVVCCASCGIELSRTPKTIPALAHEHVAGEAVRENEVAATCSKEGSYDEVVYCTGCGNELNRTPKTIEKLAHTPGDSFETNQVKATCTKAGSYDEVVLCSVCSAVISSEHKTVAAAGHTPGEPVREDLVESTCKVAGSYNEVITCSVCGDLLSSTPKTLPLADHTPGAPTEENRVESTCKLAGSYNEVITCTVCGDLLSSTPKTLPLANHTPGAAVQENRVEATCDKEGGYNEVIYCTVCGDKISSTAKTIAKTDHTDSDGDGKCDVCKQTIANEKPAEPQGKVCKYCGEVHQGFFQKIIGFFHSILALFGLRKK